MTTVSVAVAVAVAVSVSFSFFVSSPSSSQLPSHSAAEENPLQFPSDRKCGPKHAKSVCSLQLVAAACALAALLHQRLQMCNCNLPEIARGKWRGEEGECKRACRKIIVCGFPFAFRTLANDFCFQTLFEQSQSQSQSQQFTRPVSQSFIQPFTLVLMHSFGHSLIYSVGRQCQHPQR